MKSDIASIIIPTYYRNDWLRTAIESALYQTYTPVEVIVVDDSGEAHARDVVEDYDVTYITHEQNRGGNPARNTGIRSATGKYIQLLDDDDQLHPEKLERQISVLEDRDDAGVVYCGYISDGDTVLPDQEARGDVLPRTLRLRMAPCITSTMLMDRHVLKRIMPLTSRPHRDDVGMRIELAQLTEFEYVNQALVTKRQHDDQRTDKLVETPEDVKIVHEYSYLYEKRTPELKHELFETLHASHCEGLLNERFWSSAAISSGFKSLYFMLRRRRFDLNRIGLALASLFGTPGVQLGKFVKYKVYNY